MEPISSSQVDGDLDSTNSEVDGEEAWLRFVNLIESDNSSDEEALSTCSMDTFELRSAIDAVRFDYSSNDFQDTNPTIFSANYGYLRYLDEAKFLKKLLYIVRRLAMNPADVLETITSDYVSESSRASTVDLIRRAMDAMIARDAATSEQFEIIPPVSTVYSSSESTEEVTSPVSENSFISNMSTPATSLSLNDGVLIDP